MTTEPTLVTQMTPYDLTGIRDSGMRALVLLAASLGWNVLQRSGNPIVISARDGTQKRLPTNTSIRMSVYQTALSTIITHSQDVVPTVELIDRIVETVKLDRDHERRMRLAIGESAEEHKRRLATVPAAERKREPDEHLTQRIEVPVDEVGDFPVAADEIEFVDELPAAKPEMVSVLDTGAADKGDHGKVKEIRPFMAHRAGRGTGSKTYQSDVAYEREWEDGYIDYICIVCGRSHRAPKGIGSHFQNHYKSGEVKRPDAVAWRRAKTWGFDPEYRRPDRKERPLPEPEPEPQSTWIDDAESILEEVIELVAPNLRQQRDDALAQLAELQVKYDKLDADWKALRDLITR
jgi:hypothetical protein